MIIESSTPNALQKNWKTPTQFVLCPSEMLENPLESYLHNIAKKIIIATNQYTSCVVMDFALYDNKILVVTQDIHINAIKPYGLLTITIYGDKFLHEISTFFEQKGAEKVFTLSQGLEWIGGDGIDDYC